MHLAFERCIIALENSPENGLFFTESIFRSNEGSGLVDYITIKKASEKWGLSTRRVQDLCKQGAISGAVLWERTWMIPKNAEKPADRRRKDVADTKPVVIPERNSFMSMTNTYKEAGSAEKVLSSFEDELERDIFEMQLRFYQGNFEASKRIGLSYLQSDAGLHQRTVVGSHLALTALCTGDKSLWKKAGDFVAEAVCHTHEDKIVRDFWYAAHECTLSNVNHFADWFVRGNFEELPTELHAIARYYYVKYLYISQHDVETWKGDYHPALVFLNTMPLIIEPLITQTAVEREVIVEIYLRLMCAIAYHVSGFDTLAIPHIEKALDLAIPDKLYMPIAELRGRLGFLLDDIMNEKKPKDLVEIRKLSRTIREGWVSLNRAIKEKEVHANLSTREYQIARLAVYGLSNKEIADRLNITVNAVKQSLRLAMDKTGTNSRAQLAIHL